MNDLQRRTLASQYANSPTIVQMVESFAQQIDPSPAFDKFLSYIWNVDTAEGFGQDILGRIVGLQRQLTGVPSIYGYPPAPGGVYTMNDVQYRAALKTKILKNISNGSAGNINAELNEMSAGRGNAFVSKTGTMRIQYNFYYAPEPYEYVLARIICGRPVGVMLENHLTINPYFGFGEADSWQPFGQGVFAKY